MKIWIEYSVKDFDREKLADAIAACSAVCGDCDIGLETCLLSSNECAMKAAIESLEGMERVGRGIKRYREIKGLDGEETLNA